MAGIAIKMPGMAIMTAGTVITIPRNGDHDASES